MVQGAINKLLAPLRRRVLLMIGRAVVRLVNDTTDLQRLQITLLADETVDNVPRFQEYGFTSHPLAGAAAVVVCVHGNRDRAIAVAVDDPRYRKKGLAAGEVALYTDEGDYLHFKRGRLVEIVAGTKVKVTAPEVEVVASTKVTVTSPLVEMSGDLTVAGAITSATSVADPNGTMQEMRGTYNGHTHPENNQSGGNTNAPNQPMS